MKKCLRCSTRCGVSKARRMCKMLQSARLSTSLTRTIKNNRERIQTLLERVVDIGRGDSSRVIDDLLIWTSGYTRGLRFRQSQWLTARTLITLAPDCSSASFHRADIRSSPDNNPSLLSFKFFPALVCASFTFSVKLIFTLYKGL